MNPRPEPWTVSPENRLENKEKKKKRKCDDYIKKVQKKVYFMMGHFMLYFLFDFINKPTPPNATYIYMKKANYNNAEN